MRRSRTGPAQPDCGVGKVSYLPRAEIHCNVVANPTIRLCRPRHKLRSPLRTSNTCQSVDRKRDKRGERRREEREKRREEKRGGERRVTAILNMRTINQTMHSTAEYVPAVALWAQWTRRSLHRVRFVRSTVRPCSPFCGAPFRYGSKCIKLDTCRVCRVSRRAERRRPILSRVVPLHLPCAHKQLAGGL